MDNKVKKKNCNIINCILINETSTLYFCFLFSKQYILNFIIFIKYI